jgi:hypothetical protein
MRVQGTFGVVQGTFDVIQGTFGDDKWWRFPPYYLFSTCAVRCFVTPRFTDPHDSDIWTCVIRCYGYSLLMDFLTAP